MTQLSPRPRHIGGFADQSFNKNSYEEVGAASIPLMPADLIDLVDLCYTYFGKNSGFWHKKERKQGRRVRRPRGSNPRPSNPLRRSPGRIIGPDPGPL